MTDALADLATILAEEDIFRRPPRVAAPRVLERLGQTGWLVSRGSSTPEEELDLTAEPEEYEDDPPSWSAYSSRIRNLLADGVLTARSVVEDAVRSLGLNPDEVRAVVIEQHTVHVFRWSDSRRGQTVPVMEDS